MRLLDALEDDDDVQSVYSNADISDEDAAKFAGGDVRGHVPQVRVP